METFAAIQSHIKSRFQIVHEEPFMLGLEVPAGKSGRRQSVFLAELKGPDGRRFLRIETTVAPLGAHDAEKCLRVNMMLRTGYLAVGDMEGVAFLKLCENLSYSAISESILDYYITRIAELGDNIEQTLTRGGDWF